MQVRKKGGRPLLCALLLAGCGSSAPSAGERLDERSTTVPLVVDRRAGVQPLVDAVLAGERVRLVVDTGAARTLVDRDVARRLGLAPVGEPATLGTAGCTATTQDVRVATWSVGPRALPPVTAFSLPSPLSARLGVAGQLGADVLRAVGGVTLDRTSREVVLGRPVPGGSSLQTEPGEQGLLLARVRIGRAVARLVVDTGAGQSVLSPAVAQRAGLSPRGGADVTGVGCESRAAAAHVDAWSSGAARFPAGEVLVQAPAIPGTDGLLGADVLLADGPARVDLARGTVALGS